MCVNVSVRVMGCLADSSVNTCWGISRLVSLAVFVSWCCQVGGSRDCGTVCVFAVRVAPFEHCMYMYVNMYIQYIPPTCSSVCVCVTIRQSVGVTVVYSPYKMSMLYT